jgi:anti-sigma factor RsiW
MAAGAGLMWRGWTCRRLSGRLVDLADGTLDAAERSRLTSHLARCSDCAAAVAALQDVPALLREAEDPPGGEGFWRAQRDAIMQGVRGLPPPAASLPHGRGYRARGPGWMAWAPALAAAAVVVAAVVLRAPPPAPERAVVPATGVETLDDPTLLSLSDLAGSSMPDVERGADVLEDDRPLPELSNDELDALAQLVGVRER